MKILVIILLFLSLFAANSAHALQCAEVAPLPGLDEAHVVTLAQLDEHEYLAMLDTCSFTCDDAFPLEEEAWDACVNQCVYESGF